MGGRCHNDGGNQITIIINKVLTRISSIMGYQISHQHAI